MLLRCPQERHLISNSPTATGRRLWLNWMKLPVWMQQRNMNLFIFFRVNRNQSWIEGQVRSFVFCEEHGQWKLSKFASFILILYSNVCDQLMPLLVLHETSWVSKSIQIFNTTLCQCWSTEKPQTSVAFTWNDNEKKKQNINLIKTYGAHLKVFVSPLLIQCHYLNYRLKVRSYKHLTD